MQTNHSALASLDGHISRLGRLTNRTARVLGLAPRECEFLLILKGLPQGVSPTIGTIAGRLFIHHHSAVELTNRLEARGLVRRVRSNRDRREVMIALCPSGTRLLRKIAAQHRQSLQIIAPDLISSLTALLNGRSGGKHNRNGHLR